VPGGTAAAAHRQYQQIRQRDPRYCYYGRVVREGAYIILHYMFFYVMNNWRSTFYGVNDHEGDWEQIFIYLSDEGRAEPVPRWLAYATHEESGDNLRRRWDDPALTIIDQTHPVIFAGAGSHASYFEAGEYLSQFRLQILEPMRNVLQFGRRFWVETLQQGQSSTDVSSKQVDDLFAIPFIDYAIGDGMAIGHGQSAVWTPILVDEKTGWLQHYRGLWGLDTRDPFGGERAPAGPKFNRDGTIRQSWHNPLGWSGLHKVSPPRLAISQLEQHIPHMEAQLQQLRDEISSKRDALRLLDLEARALLTAEYMDKLYDERSEQLQEQEKALNALYDQAADLEDTLLAARGYLEDMRQGNFGDPRTHLTHLRSPLPPQPGFNRFVEFWAALSSGLLVLMLALSLIITPGNWMLHTFVIIAAFFLIEALLRQQLARLLLNVTLLLAILTSAVLIVEFLPLVVVALLLALARLLLVENWREVRRH
jgi:hypothetical protein